MANWWSEPFGPNGGSAGSGIKNQLGRPTLPHYTVVVREAVQNSWDARILDSIRFRIEIRKLGNLVKEWQNLIAAGVSTREQQLLTKLTENSLLLIVSDRGTSGLGGPLRSDEPVPEGTSADFVQFLRNIGEPRDTALGGGTYGYGKSIFFRSSLASTILVNTRVKNENALQLRLMGASITDPFDGSDRRRFTGRHWWGELQDDVIMPLLDDDAEHVAQRLGLPAFQGSDTGTDIVVLLPNLDFEGVEGEIDQLVDHLRAAIYWNLWPKMISRNGVTPIQFEILVDGRSIEMPSYEEVPIIRDFALALEKHSEKTSKEFSMRGDDRKIGSYTVTTPIGFLEILAYFTKTVRVSKAAKTIVARMPFKEPVRHIVRMRNPELVVDYFEGNQLGVQEIGYVGVFKVCDNFDEVFASSEPPTHDSWESSMLSGHSRGIVRESVSFLNRETTNFVKARSGAQTKVVRGLSRLSNSLASFVEPAISPAFPIENRNEKSRKAKMKRAAKQLTIFGESRVEVFNGLASNILEFQVTLPKEIVMVVECIPEVLLGNGRIENPRKAPLGAQKPAEPVWISQKDGQQRFGRKVRFMSSDAGEWQVIVPCLENAAMRLRLREVK